MSSIFSEIWSKLTFKPIQLLLIPLVGAAYGIYVFSIRPLFSNFRQLPGPRRESLLYGNLKKVINSGPGEAHAAWIKEFGITIKYTIFMGAERFYTIDPAAISYMFQNAYNFPKPPRVRQSLAEIMGKGILFAEDEPHKRQRRLLLPAFSPQSIKDLTPLFLQKAYELVEKINSLNASGVSSLEGTDEPTIDMLYYLGRATLDVIGEAGFDYQFEALQNEENELANAFRDMFAAGNTITPFVILQELVPIFKLIPTDRSRRVAKSLAIMNRVGDGIVAKKKEEILSSGEKVEKSNLAGKDLLSILMRSNLAADVPESQRMSDEEIRGQISTFLLAGFETSSTALAWTIYALSEDPQIQSKLREELLSVTETEPSLDSLNSLTYLDAVIKESLRLLSPVPATIRVAGADDNIPLQYPVKGNDGKMINSVHIKKGQTIFLPILTYNTSEMFWGDDAMEFKPERWLSDLPKSAQDLEVPWARVNTFIGGPRGCIGYRFALAEIKAILFVLLREFTFEHPTPKPEYERKTSIVTRMHIKNAEKKGAQLPLVVKPYRA